MKDLREEYKMEERATVRLKSLYYDRYVDMSASEKAFWQKALEEQKAREDAAWNAWIDQYKEF